MAVDRCICKNVLFAEVLRLHREEGLDFDEILQRTGIGSDCGQCVPYVRLTLASGSTDHAPMTWEQYQALVAG